MAYEAAAAVAMRDQHQSQVRTGEDNGGAKGRRQQPVEEKAVVVRHRQLAAAMAYEAAAAVALGEHLRHGGEKGRARSHGKTKQVKKEERVVKGGGALWMVKRVLPLSGSGSGKK
nr:unnamed protein product [Digitaria exilis]